MKKSKKVTGKSTQAQRVALALAFVGEHKELFEDWLQKKREGALNV